jgi:hypothetical protein
MIGIDWVAIITAIGAIIISVVNLKSNSRITELTLLLQIANTKITALELKIDVLEKLLKSSKPL